MVCGKEFFLKWRLKKHSKIHSEVTRQCKYFLADEACPFDKIGCMFSHERDTAKDTSANDDEKQRRAHKKRGKLSVNKGGKNRVIQKEIVVNQTKTHDDTASEPIEAVEVVEKGNNEKEERIRCYICPRRWKCNRSTQNGKRDRKY